MKLVTVQVPKQKLLHAGCDGRCSDVSIPIQVALVRIFNIV